MIFLTVLLFTGCNEISGVHINRKVVMLGVDYVDGKYIACIQLVKGEIEINYNDIELECYHGKSTSVMEALDEAVLKSGTKLSWINLRTVVIGEDAAIKGMSEIISALNENSEISRKTPLAIVTPTALGFIRENTHKNQRERILIESSLSNDEPKRSNLNSTILSVSNSMEDKGTGGLVSLISTQSTADKNYTLGSAVIYEGKLVAVLNNDLTQTVLWLKDKSYALSTEMFTDRISIIGNIIKQSKFKLKPVVSDGKLVFIAQIDLDGSMTGEIATQKTVNCVLIMSDIS